MIYRKFGKTNEEVSALGFGAMRLPVIDGDPTKIDEEKAIEMIRYAIDNGVNYVDTAYPYHGNDFSKGGQSEPLVGKALKDGYREKVNIATKLPSWLVQTRDDMDRLLNDQLERLQTDHVDFYLVHTLNKQLWPNLKRLGIDDFLNKAIEDGRIRYAGFSFHDDIETFKEIADSYDWSFCQIQYNYLDENYQAGKEGLEYAAKKGLGISIMEPLRGGSLTNKLPDEISDIWNEADAKRTPVEWALRWVWNHPEVSVVLSGMTEMDHVVENIKTAEASDPNSLTEKEIELVERVKNIFKEKMKVNCTNCRYCMPCPVGVDIPQNFAIYNDAYLFDDIARGKMMYSMFLSADAKAANCVECGKCEGHCPQNIPIRQQLRNVKEAFE